MTSPIRVLCVDDHQIVREGLALIINQEPDMQVVGSAASADRLQPDVTLMDLRLRGRTGVDAIVAIRRENADARIIVLTMYEGDEDIRRALAAGAATYLTKDIVSDELIRVVREVHTGMTPGISGVRTVLEQHASLPRLTPREVEVLELVSRGMRNKEIAASLGITRETVVVQVRNIFTKLGVTDRTGAVRAGVERGIIHIG
jgi:DNA-binding NarL/FixJ family response regulator